MIYRQLSCRACTSRVVIFLRHPAWSAVLPSWVLESEAAEAANVDKSKLADLAISHATKLGAIYADIRINRYRNESIFTREQQVQNVSRTQSFGFGARVLVKGAWGFAASHVV